jgi:hypothetical protein
VVLLVALTTGLAAAFVVAPARLAATSSSRDLTSKPAFDRALDKAFVAYWDSGLRDRPPSLDRVVAYFFRYHVAKGVLAALVLAALAALGVQIWKAFLRSDGDHAGRQMVLGSVGVLVTALAVLSLVTVMANIQGAVAPFSSMLPMVGETGPDHALTRTLEQRNRALSASLTSGTPRPAPLDAMVDDFARYHAVLALLAVVVAVALLGMSALLLWKRLTAMPAADRRSRRAVVSAGVVAALLALLMVVLAVANAGTAADPAPALLAAFEGGR